MIVMTIIAILGGIAVPMYRAHVRYTKETVLRADLRQMREGIDQYTADKKKPPQSLNDLVEAGYLREVPVDPFTYSKATWQAVVDASNASVDETVRGVVNVHSGSGEVSSEEKAYSAW
jgi:general secretion pathway protein G